MAVTIGILGFMLALFALFIGSEALRRVHQRMLDLETSLYRISVRMKEAETEIVQSRDMRQKHESLLSLSRDDGNKSTAAAESPESLRPTPYTPHSAAHDSLDTTRTKQSGTMPSVKIKG